MNLEGNRKPNLEISIIIPFLNEEDTVVPLYEKLVRVMEGTGKSFEIIYIDDGSTDTSTERLRGITELDDRVALIVLRGNYGKSAALCAGFNYARGAIFVTMDADLQDDPEELPRFFEKIAEGYDVVSGFKKQRHDPWSKVVQSRVFNWLVRLLTDVKLNDVNCGFKSYRREVLDEILIYGEMHRLIPILAAWRRFRVGEIEVRHHPRRHGRSKFGYLRVFRGMMDLLTVSFLMRYSQSPSYLFGLFGAILFFLGLLISGYLSVLWFAGMGPIGNRPLLFLGILMIITGFQFFSHGLIAEMTGFLLTKREHVYAISRIYGIIEGKISSELKKNG